MKPSENKRLRGGVIGLGKMGMVHATIINCLEHSHLAAVCEPTKLIYNTFREFAPHVNVYSDHREMLKKQELDFVFITTPSFLHIPMALDCVDSGCHIFVEKPLSVNAEDALPLIERLAGTRLISMTGYMMRYLATFHKAKEILDSGVLGKAITFNSRMYVSQLFKEGKGWRYDLKKSGGGVIIMQATHAIDMLCWFFGFPDRLNASLINAYSTVTEDFGHIVFNWQNGLMGWLDSSWSVHNHRMLETTFEIHGTKGTLVVNDDTVKLFLAEARKNYPSGWTIITRPEIEKGVAIDIGGPQFTRQDKAFIDGILNGVPLESDVSNGFKVQQIVDAIYRSANENGQTKTIP